MNKIIGTTLVSFVALLCIVTTASGQTKKNEQKVKVIVSDGGSTRVLIDTVMYDTKKKEHLKTKNGDIVVITSDRDTLNNPDKDGKEMIVTVVSDDNDHNEKNETISVISSDSAYSHNEGGKTFTYFVNKGGPGEKGKNEKYDRFIYDMKGGPEHENKISYMISRDGFVITVEGSDEARTKELFKVIDNKIDEMSGSKEEKVSSKETVTKTIKK